MRGLVSLVEMRLWEVGAREMKAGGAWRLFLLRRRELAAAPKFFALSGQVFDVRDARRRVAPAVRSVGKTKLGSAFLLRAWWCATWDVARAAVRRRFGVRQRECRWGPRVATFSMEALYCELFQGHGRVADWRRAKNRVAGERTERDTRESHLMVIWSSLKSFELRRGRRIVVSLLGRLNKRCRRMDSRFDRRSLFLMWEHAEIAGLNGWPSADVISPHAGKPCVTMRVDPENGARP